MQKFYFPLFLVLVVFAAGCGVKAESYVMTRERVDQGSTGNNGCLSGECPAQEPLKKTRKVYVLEVTKPVVEGKVKKIEQASEPVAQEPQEDVVNQAKEVASSDEEEPAVLIPAIEDDPVKASAAVSVPEQSYTVQKDDTLQKIAKKFYGSYSKWIMIYEANKERLKNPNVVRPGTVLTLPAYEKKEE